MQSYETMERISRSEVSFGCCLSYFFIKNKNQNTNQENWSLCKDREWLEEQPKKRNYQHDLIDCIAQCLSNEIKGMKEMRCFFF